MRYASWVIGLVVMPLAAACGGNASEASSSGTASGGASSGGSGGTGATGGTGGTAGSGGSQPTTTGGTGGTGAGGTGGNPEACPTIEPAAGTACGDEGLSCYYNNCQAPDYRANRELWCEEGAWLLYDEVVCEQGGCPDPVPQLNYSCNENRTPGPCPVIDACGSERTAFCEVGRWRLASDNDLAPVGAGGAGGESSDVQGAAGAGTLAPPACPEVAPFAGSLCCPSTVLAVCDYGTSDAGTGGNGSGDSATGSGTSGFPISLDCAVCNDDMRWAACP